MKLGKLGKLVYNVVLSVLPPAAAEAIRDAEQAIADPNNGDKKKAIADARVIGSSAIAALNAVAGSDLGGDPRVQAIVERVNKTIHDAAKEIALLADATDGKVDGN